MKPREIKWEWEVALGQSIGSLYPILEKVLGNQSGIFTGRTDTEGEAPVLWSPDAKN